MSVLAAGVYTTVPSGWATASVGIDVTTLPTFNVPSLSSSFNKTSIVSELPIATVRSSPLPSMLSLTANGATFCASVTATVTVAVFDSTDESFSTV